MDHDQTRLNKWQIQVNYLNLKARPLTPERIEALTVSICSHLTAYTKLLMLVPTLLKLNNTISYFKIQHCRLNHASLSFYLSKEDLPVEDGKKFAFVLSLK